jgi:hypothetical protein
MHFRPYEKTLKKIMKGHLTSYKQENIFKIEFGLFFLLLFIFFKKYIKTKNL